MRVSDSKASLQAASGTMPKAREAAPRCTPSPIPGDLPRSMQVIKQICAQHLTPVSLIDLRDESALLRLAGLDAADLDIVLLTPAHKGH